MAGRSDDEIRCSFCGKSQGQVRKLIAGPKGAYICDECVDICAEIIEEEFENEEETGTATMKDLYHERRCELAFEFTDHLFDLKRWNRSSNADIKTLADKELNAHPRIRRYEDRANPVSAFTIIG